MPEEINEDIDRLLGYYDAHVQEISLRTRSLISKLIPKAEEKVYFGWRIIRFSINGEMSGQFIAIGPHKNYINLYFMQGTSLEDPKALLTGTGKNMRHVKITDPEELKNAALKELIKTAARHQQEKLQQTTPK